MKQKGKILIIENEDAWIKVFQRALVPYTSPNSNLTILVAKSPEDAENVIKAHKDLVLSIVDIKLRGDGRSSNDSGLELLHFLKLKGVPSIAVSAYADEQIIVSSFVDGGAKNFWLKPQRTANKQAEEILSLRHMIETLLAKPSSVIETNEKIDRRFRTYFLTLFFSGIFIISISALLVYLFPGNFKDLLVLSISWFGFITISTALFTGKITGKDYKEIILGIKGGQQQQ